MNAQENIRGLLYDFFTDDHKRLEALLSRATEHLPKIDGIPYAEFRRGLLKHISMEEKILFPAVRRFGGKALPETEQLRLDHSALAALMVPPPSPGIIAAVRAILARHNELEEKSDGVYETCERLAGDELKKLMEEILNDPEVPVLPHNENPGVLDATRRALARAGYDLADDTK